MDERNKPVQTSTTEVLAEVKRRRAERPRPMSEGQRQTIIFVDRLVFWFSKHWLAVANVLAFAYVGLPVLAPVLMYLGAEDLGMIIHRLYRPLCHQLPQRSFFLFGPRLVYTLPELLERVGASEMANQWSGQFVGNETVGYKIAFCQRDLAIYGAILVAGLAYALLRRWRPVPPLPGWAYLLGLLPMALDGGYQLLSNAAVVLWPDWPLGAYESPPLMRVVTGALFGVVTVWLAYPYVQEATDEFKEKLHQRFGWE